MNRNIHQTVGRGSVWTLGLIALLSLSVGLGGSCGGGTDPKPVPEISLVSVSDYDILPGDIVTIRFTTSNTDSVLMYPGAVKIDLSDTTTSPIQLFLPTELIFVAYNSQGVDSLTVAITMSAATAQINSFAVSEAVIVGGDSTSLSWSVSNADSIVVNNGVGKLSGNSGSIFVKPASTTTYRAIAYYVAHDTATVSVTVEVYAALENLSAIYFKGEMNSSTVEPPFGFRIRTTDGPTATMLYIHYEIVEGDGTLSADSLLSGGPQPSYTFDGALGHAILRAKVPGEDSVDVYIRANTLIPGLSGQGQYVKFSDNYGWVQTYNGLPEKSEYDPFSPDELYVVYEATKGVVVIVYDPNQDHTPFATDPVIGVIVNSIYDKTTPEGLGIDSSYDKMISGYGVPDTTWVNTDSIPFMDVHQYDSLGMTVWIRQTDSLVEELHLVNPELLGPVSSPAAEVLRRNASRLKSGRLAH